MNLLLLRFLFSFTFIWLFCFFLFKKNQTYYFLKSFKTKVQRLIIRCKTIMLRRKRRSHQRAEQRDSDACGAPSTLFVCVHYSLLHGLSDPKYG